ncbi:unnamed protein product [Phaeothamnion confervicola]
MLTQAPAGGCIAPALQCAGGAGSCCGVPLWAVAACAVFLLSTTIIAIDYARFTAAAARTYVTHILESIRDDGETIAAGGSMPSANKNGDAVADAAATTNGKGASKTSTMTAASSPEPTCCAMPTTGEPPAVHAVPPPPSPPPMPLPPALPAGRGYGMVAFLSCALAASLALRAAGELRLAKAAALGGLVAWCLPYLCQASAYRRDPRLGCQLSPADKRRGVGDMLVWTSFIYIVPAVYGVHAHQYGIAVLQAATSVGSTLFHLTRETMCFNLDNIFAQSLLLTTLWGLCMAAWHGVWAYVGLVASGLPLAAYFLVGCGMPGLICCHPAGRCHGVVRRSNPDYDFFHMCWCVFEAWLAGCGDEAYGRVYRLPFRTSNLTILAVVATDACLLERMLTKHCIVSYNASLTLCVISPTNHLVYCLRRIDQFGASICHVPAAGSLHTWTHLIALLGTSCQGWARWRRSTSSRCTFPTRRLVAAGFATSPTCPSCPPSLSRLAPAPTSSRTCTASCRSHDLLLIRSVGLLGGCASLCRLLCCRLLFAAGGPLVSCMLSRTR